MMKRTTMMRQARLASSTSENGRDEEATACTRNEAVAMVALAIGTVGIGQ